MNGIGSPSNKIPYLSTPFLHFMKRIRIKDKHFTVYIPSEQIQKRIDEVAEKINTELAGKRPLFLAVLNGSFLFAADLMKRLTIDCEISFIKVASYHGTSSSGNVKQLIGLNEDLRHRTVVVLEDIVDTGLTLESLRNQIMKMEPRELKFVTLLFKPEAYTRDIKIDYIGLEVPNHFLVGYGLDYDGLGRNMEDIFVLEGTDITNQPNPNA
jgi:hypoxanthine phosphoribosyltransferase